MPSGTRKVLTCSNVSDLVIAKNRPGSRYYGEYVIVRVPATLAIVIVVPCEKPEG
jgi:hypothetical protein